MKGYPPKIILLRLGNKRRKELAEILVNAGSEIENLDKNDYGLLEII